MRDLGLEGAKISKLPGSKEEHKRTGGPTGPGEYPVLGVSAENLDKCVDHSG